MNLHATGLASLLLINPLWANADQTITGAGSSAAAPIYRAWAQAYEKTSGIKLNYEPSGSSAGLRKIRAGETDFGASDVAPSEAELSQAGLVLFPIAITGITPVVNLPKVGDSQLRLTGDVLARIFMGEITHWNAPALVQINPDIKLPDLAIRVVVRSDGSGTTYNFADYLSKVNPTWKTKNGVKSSFAWPDGFTLAKGSDGVVKAVKEASGTIAYVDFGYVRDNQLNTIQLKNQQGDFLKPSVESFKNALNNSEWVSKGTFTATLTAKPGKGSWPITMGTFVAVPQVTDTSVQTQRALSFFIWSFMNGDRLVQDSNFVRLPDRIQALAVKAISSVRDKTGHSVGMGLVSSAGPNR